MRWWVALLTVLVVAADMATKEMVRETIPLGTTVPVIENVFHLTHVRNPGAAFGLFAGNSLLLIVVPVLIIVLLALMAPELTRDRLQLRLGFALLLAGAVGNLTDRVRLGYVTDFIDLRVWPVFNIADMAVVIGVGLFILDALKDMHEPPEESLRSAPGTAAEPDHAALAPPPPPPPVPGPVSRKQDRGEEPDHRHGESRSVENDSFAAAARGSGGALR